jgi:hypothetical protein
MGGAGIGKLELFTFSLKIIKTHISQEQINHPPLKSNFDEPGQSIDKKEVIN